MSIGKAQAEALAVGFLDDIGEGGIEDLQPKETISELILLAAEFVEDAQKNLVASNSVASGNLSSSIVADEPITQPGKLTINIEMLPYGLFVNAGVKGTKAGSSTAGYSFKNDRPGSATKYPKGMVAMIAEWIKRGKISTSNTNAKKTISVNERKNASIGQISNAYAVARSIKRHGLKPTGFLDKAVQTTSDKVLDRLGAAFQIDILNSLTR
jgi:hypothetical protein